MQKEKKPVSTKQSAKERRAARIQQQQRQQQILLTVAGVVLLVIVLGLIFVSTRPVEAKIPDGVLDYYKPYEDKGYVGTTDEGYPFIGAKDAPTTIQSIESFACPVCLSFHDTIYKNLRDEILAGRLKFVYIPVTSTGDFAVENATHSAMCVSQQGKFWEMHDILFNWQTTYAAGTDDTRRLADAAKQMGLDMDKYNTCLSSDYPQKVIDAGQAFMNSNNVTGTPGVFMDGKQVDVMSGTPSLSEIRGYIESKAPPAS